MLILVSLIFLSKVSFVFLPGIPYQESFLIFQHGMHPFINVTLNIIIGCWLILKFGLKKEHQALQFSGYKFYLFAFCLYILLITILQALLVESENPVYLQIGMALSACFTVYLYSRVIPSELSAHKFFIFLKNISLTFCLLSLVALVLFPDLTFKGGRFIGVFKHIPYMVTTATVACGFMIYDLFATNKSRYKKILIFCCLLLCLLTLILTGTRSALLAVILSYCIAFVVFPAKKALSQFLKVSTAITCLLGVLFFGNIITDHVINVIRGNESVGLRAAQDGVASRLDEFQRGLESFQNSPFLGHGLLSKFGEINENDVGQYNANKDPHNLLVSAGVIGGIFFIVIVALGFLMLIFKSMQKLKSKDPVYKVMAIYMITQLPILFIYHMHLSMGGMADRVYWLIVGYMCIKEYTHSTRG